MPVRINKRYGDEELEHLTFLKWEKWPNRDVFVPLSNFWYIVCLVPYPVNYEDFLLGSHYGVFNGAGASAQSRVPGFPDNGSLATVRFYPNPATSFITFEDFSKKYDKNYTIQLFNFLGKKVYEFNLGDQKNIVNLSDFFRGIYIFQLETQRAKLLKAESFR